MRKHIHESKNIFDYFQLPEHFKLAHSILMVLKLNKTEMQQRGPTISSAHFNSMSGAFAIRKLCILFPCMSGPHQSEVEKKISRTYKAADYI